MSRKKLNWRPILRGEEGVWQVRFVFMYIILVIILSFLRGQHYFLTDMAKVLLIKLGYKVTY